jgi:hypothetical protein
VIAFLMYAIRQIAPDPRKNLVRLTVNGTSGD